MKEIRFHGRGGQGVVSAAQILVQTVVEQGGYAHFIPFFGVERKGSPVYGFLRLDTKPIRLKTQVYDPHCVVVFDDTLIQSVPVFDGLQNQGIAIINSACGARGLKVPPCTGKLGLVNATGIALDMLGSQIPNTAMLGALAKVTGWVEFDRLSAKITAAFGESNARVATEAYNNTLIHNIQEADGCE